MQRSKYPFSSPPQSEFVRKAMAPVFKKERITKARELVARYQRELHVAIVRLAAAKKELAALEGTE